MKPTVVVKLGGTTIADDRGVLESIPAVRRERPLVLVHGGGKRLTEWLGRLGVETRFEAGRRVTDDAAIEAAVAVFGGVVNAEVVAALVALGEPAIGISGIDGGLLRGRRVEGLGRVVEPESVETGLLEGLLDTGLLPVVAPLALDPDGTICNVNADDAAAALAAALEATLVLLTDTDGVLDAAGARITTLDPAATQRLIADGVIAGGMLAKVRAGSAALERGAHAVVIAHGAAPDALARALSDHDFGTRLAPRFPTYAMGVKLGVDLDKALALDAALQDEELIRRHRLGE